MLKKIVKNTFLYQWYKRYKLYKVYSRRFNGSFFSALLQMKVTDSDLSEILRKSRIRNIGEGHFFYSIDTAVVIKHRKTVIENMPVDYGYVINHKIGDTDIEKEVKKYVRKINDPRIKLDCPVDLQSALQAILFWNSLLWQSGHSLVGLGRLDKILDSYDVPSNAEELITEFLQTLHGAYTYKSASLKGDTGQIIILGGAEKDGSYFCNEYTKLFICALMKLHLPDPKILLRCSSNMPFDLIQLAVESNATGIGYPLFSNDDVIIPKLIDFGYEPEDAYNYGVSACWEPLSIGNSLEQNNLANIEYGKCINEAILDSGFLKCRKLEDVLELFNIKLSENCKAICSSLDSIEWEKDPLLSFMMGLDKDISEGGAKYNNYGVLSVGMSSAVNSLINIDRFVFSEKKYSLTDLQNVIASDYADGKGPFDVNPEGFGTDNDEAVKLTNYLIEETENLLKGYRNRFGGKVKFGLSSPSYMGVGANTGATLDGRKCGEPFPTHISRDKGEALTEIMNFESQLKFTGTSANANVIDIMVQASLIKDNTSKFALLILGGLKEGIFQLQMNVLSYAELVDAKAHPEKYPNLIVRVWGFSAYFNDLPEEYKDNLIKRAKEMENVA